MVWATATHTVLEAFTAADWAARSVLLYTRSTCSSRPYWHAGAGLPSITTLHIVRPLRHSYPWTRLELLYRLSVADTNGGLILVLRLLVGTVGRLLVLLLLLVHVRA